MDGIRKRPCHAFVLLAFLVSLTAAKVTVASELIQIHGGTFQMGSDQHSREEGPVREVTVGSFVIGRRTEVTDAQFRTFVEATGYVTTAERGLRAEDHPNWPPELLAPGSMVFAQPSEQVNLADPNRLWRWVVGASWRAPEGPQSSIEGRDDHPGVQVSPEDAAAYAAWVGGRLPTEAEWEFAARAGVLDGTLWDESYDPVSGWKANVWQGAFPAYDLADDGHHGSAPVASFAANAFRVHDMLGNVWEHVSDWWVPGHPDGPQTDPQGPPEALAARYAHPELGANNVVKGES